MRRKLTPESLRQGAELEKRVDAIVRLSKHRISAFIPVRKWPRVGAIAERMPVCCTRSRVAAAAESGMVSGNTPIARNAILPPPKVLHPIQPFSRSA